MLLGRSGATVFDDVATSRQRCAGTKLWKILRLTFAMPTIAHPRELLCRHAADRFGTHGVDQAGGSTLEEWSRTVAQEAEASRRIKLDVVGPALQKVYNMRKKELTERALQIVGQVSWNFGQLHCSIAVSTLWTLTDPHTWDAHATCSSSERP